MGVAQLSAPYFGHVFSPDRQYRYTLTRFTKVAPGYEDVKVSRTPGRMLNVIGLNPSTADETLNDPTVRRCIGFARDWDFGTLVVTNAFAYRAPRPAVLLTVDDPVGPLNDRYLTEVARAAHMVVVAWSGAATLGGRNTQALGALRDLGVPLYCFGLTKYGHPRHPLYVKKDVEPMVWRPQK